MAQLETAQSFHKPINLVEKLVEQNTITRGDAAKAYQFLTDHRDADILIVKWNSTKDGRTDVYPREENGKPGVINTDCGDFFCADGGVVKNAHGRKVGDFFNLVQAEGNRAGWSFLAIEKANLNTSMR